MALSLPDEVAKLVQLHEDGHLSQDELQQGKKLLLSPTWQSKGLAEAIVTLGESIKAAADPLISQAEHRQQASQMQRQEDKLHLPQAASTHDEGHGPAKCPSSSQSIFKDDKPEALRSSVVNKHVSAQIPVPSSTSIARGSPERPGSLLLPSLMNLDEFELLLKGGTLDVLVKTRNGCSEVYSLHKHVLQTLPFIQTQLNDCAGIVEIPLPHGVCLSHFVDLAHRLYFGRYPQLVDDQRDITGAFLLADFLKADYLVEEVSVDRARVSAQMSDAAIDAMVDQGSNTVASGFVEMLKDCPERTLGKSVQSTVLTKLVKAVVEDSDFEKALPTLASTLQRRAGQGFGTEDAKTVLLALKTVVHREYKEIYYTHSNSGKTSYQNSRSRYFPRSSAAILSVIDLVKHELVSADVYQGAHALATDCCKDGNNYYDSFTVTGLDKNQMKDAVKAKEQPKKSIPGLGSRQFTVKQVSSGASGIGIMQGGELRIYSTREGWQGFTATAPVTINGIDVGTPGSVVNNAQQVSNYILEISLQLLSAGIIEMAPFQAILERPQSDDLLAEALPRLESKRAHELANCLLAWKHVGPLALGAISALK